MTAVILQSFKTKGSKVT